MIQLSNPLALCDNGVVSDAFRNTYVLILNYAANYMIAAACSFNVPISSPLVLYKMCNRVVLCVVCTATSSSTGSSSNSFIHN